MAENAEWSKLLQLLCRRDYHEELAVLVIYIVRQGHLKTARDIILVMLVNK